MKEKIEKEIEVKAEQITSNLIAFMKELDTEANKQIKELELDIEFYKNENAELKEKWLQATDEGTSWAHRKSLEIENAELKEQNRSLLESCEGATMMYKDLCKAKEIIKKYLAIGVGGKITQNYLDVTKEAEQFLKIAR